MSSHKTNNFANSSFRQNQKGERRLQEGPNPTLPASLVPGPKQQGQGEESSQGSLDPSRPVSMIPESRQAGPESKSNVDNAGINVKP